MIVYNVLRRWFTEKVEAERYRIAEGLKPAATAKLDIRDRVDLANLLNMLCEPPKPGARIVAPATPEIVDRAAVGALDFDYIEKHVVPKFLHKEHDERAKRRAAKG
jgi:hypothetical protein